MSIEKKQGDFMKLLDYGLKSTKTRERILQILDFSKDPLTAEDVYKKIIDENINLSTVYRTLSTFVEKGIVIKDVLNDGKSAYSLKREKHHHVLVCNKCGKKIYLTVCPFKEAYKDIYKDTGFKVQDHSMAVYGLCSECQNDELIKNMKK